jgi:hypothetical protein
MTDRPTTLAAALAELQTRLPTVQKTETANAGTYSYKYAGLPSITSALMPLLGAVGLSFTARPTFVDDRFVLVYKLLHESGELEEGFYPLPPPTALPQSIGSAITYARRYALCALTGLAAEDDDDGRMAQAEQKPERQQRRARRAPEPPEQTWEPEGTDNRDATYEMPEQTWDPADQESLVDGWMAEINGAKDDAELAAVGKRIGQAKRRLSPNSIDKLAVAGANRKAELNGGGDA